jgi:hypothetical protein
MEDIGLGLLVLFFMVSFVKSGLNIKDFSRPETLFRFFIQIIVAKAIVSYGMTIITAIFNVGGLIVAGVTNAAELSGSSLAVPSEIIAAVNDTGFFGQIGLMLVSLIGVLGIVVALMIVKLKVYGRFFTISMFAALAPIPLAGVAGSETSFMAKAFIRGFCSVVIEGAIIMLACGLWAGLASFGNTEILSGVSSTTLVFAYLFEVLFGVVLLVTSIMSSDKIAHKIMGL